MTAAIGPADVDRFRVLLRERLGLQLDDGERDGLVEVLRERMLETGADQLDAYLRRLASPATEKAELRAVAERITVGETYFFRNRDQLTAFERVALPDRARARSETPRLRILSAGCASGEEPYTLAILIRESLPDLVSAGVSILGIDINASLLGKARRARYSPWALRQAPEHVRGRYFRAEGRELLLDEGIRGMVSFEERNLAEEEPGFWSPDSFDVVFFRNVAIYLSVDAIRAIVDRFARALAPGGFLFLGDAETLRNVSHEFHLRHTHGAFYYQRRDASESRPAQAGKPPALRAAEPALSAPLVAASDSWVEAIRRASERIDGLVRGQAAPPAGAAAAPPRRSWDLGPAKELVRQERFTEALEVLRVLPRESESDPDVQLLLAALLTNRGRVAEAESVCEVVLGLDELNAGAHYLKALCREHAGDLAAAGESDQKAIYLDPTFAMPHLHLGLLARRAGSLDEARSSLGRAIELLGREDASRVLLFGGGFNREALAQLCRAELQACGGGT